MLNSRMLGMLKLPHVGQCHGPFDVFTLCRHVKGDAITIFSSALTLVSGSSDYHFLSLYDYSQFHGEAALTSFIQRGEKLHHSGRNSIFEAQHPLRLLSGTNISQ